MALLVGASAESPAPVPWDTACDTWVATDGLGRRLPDHPEVGGPRDDRTVAMFYLLWHGPHVNGSGPWDNTRILAAHPDALRSDASPPWGPRKSYHHWGESIFGYYLTDDAAVLRTHARMLADAGVDAVALDTTNQFTYRIQYRALLAAFDEVRRAGGRPPRIAFLCPFGNPAKVVDELWRDLYSQGLHRDLWFLWDGKPLILADPDRALDHGDTGPDTERKRSFFTFRKPQPSYFAGPTQPDMWSWLEVHPQHVYRNAKGEKEMMAVGVAQNAVGHQLSAMSEPGARGRSFHDGAKDTTPGAVRQGLNFAEQWRHARAEDPRLVFITGWNEWIAMRLDKFKGAKGPSIFVDQFDQEHSRDIEPMKGGHGDDYYWQLVAEVRRYKGVRPPPPACTRRTMRLDDTAAWATVVPEYRDDIGDPMRRDHPGWNDCTRYVDRSGRNDIVTAKVAWDDTTVFFHVRTRSAMTPATDPHWMMLFIDRDADPRTGWLGYDLVVNRSSPTATMAVVERCTGGWQWERCGEVPFRVAGDTLVLAMPRTVLGIGQCPATIDFKWADNIQETGDWSDFLLHGDAAPNSRFNYRARLGPQTTGSRRTAARLLLFETVAELGKISGTGDSARTQGHK